MKWILLTAPTQKEKWADEARNLYIGKLNHFISFSIQSLKPTKNSRDQKESKVQQESEAFLRALSTDDFVILFDERGKNLSSLEFSKQLEKVLLSGKKRAVFLIGGAFGVGEEVKARAEVKISLSPMVLNHLVAETVALEQIYRAWTIIKKLPYHNV